MSYSRSINQAVSLKSLINAPISKDEEKVSMNKSSNVPEYPPFDTKKFGADYTAKELTDKLLNITRSGKGKDVHPVLSVNAFSLPYEVNKTFKYSQPSILARPDLFIYKRLMMNGLKSFAEPTINMYRGNGTRKGLANRMSQQLIIRKFDPKLSLQNLDRVYRLLPIRKVEEWPTRIDVDDKCFSNINASASAGFPYCFIVDNNNIPKFNGTTKLPLEYRKYESREDKYIPITVPLGKPIRIADHAFYWANKMFRIIDDSANVTQTFERMDKFYEKYPELKTFLLKRKEEKMDREDYDKKVRPYGAMPSATKLLNMWSGKFLEENMDNFETNSESISAYHFSSFYGGASVITNHFGNHYMHVTTQTGGYVNRRFKAISYGDDQLWMIILGYNSKGERDPNIPPDLSPVIFLNPDVRAMDMNSQSDTIISAGKWIQHNCPDIPTTNYNCVMNAIRLAYRHYMHVDGPYVVSKTESMLSGVNLTTILNIHNSARIVAVMEKEIELVEEYLTVENIFKIIAKCFYKVKTELNYTFKNFEELSFDVNNKTLEELVVKYEENITLTDIRTFEIEGLNLPFLGMVIKKITVDDCTGLVCVPSDVHKLGASLILSGNSADKNINAKRMERIIGVLFSGGWVDEKFYTTCVEIYTELSKGVDQVVGFSDLHPSLEIDTKEILDVMMEEGKFTIPSRRFFLDMNVLEKQAFVDKYINDNSKSKVEKSVIKSPSGGKEEVDKEQFEELVAELDVNLIDNSKVPEVDRSKMGNANANTIQQDENKKLRAYNKRYKKKLLYFVNKISTSSKNGGRISELQTLIENYDEQTDDDMFAVAEEYIENGELDEDLTDQFYSTWRDYSASYDKYEEWEIDEEYNVIEGDDSGDDEYDDGFDVNYYNEHGE